MALFSNMSADTDQSLLVDPVRSSDVGSPRSMSDCMSDSPDANAWAFVGKLLDPLRYATATTNTDPREAPALIAEFVPREGRVLDVGCGAGDVALVVQKLRHARVVGVEPDLERANLAKSRGIDVVHGYLTRELAPTLGRFDAVIFADVLEHVADPLPLLQLGCSLLTSRGVVVISVPNVAHWSVRWALLRGHFDYDEFGIMDATHLRWFTADSMRRWLRNAGLEVQAIRQAAGTNLSVYDRSWPWRSLHAYHRFSIIRLLTKRWPLLFGAQHVICASLQEG
jgi:methionine biosynthesis protein MetW